MLLVDPDLFIHTVLMTPTFGAKLADLGEATIKNVEATMTSASDLIEWHACHA